MRSFIHFGHCRSARCLRERKLLEAHLARNAEVPFEIIMELEYWRSKSEQKRSLRRYRQQD